MFKTYVKKNGAVIILGELENLFALRNVFYEALGFSPIIVKREEPEGEFKTPYISIHPSIRKSFNAGEQMSLA